MTEQLAKEVVQNLTNTIEEVIQDEPSPSSQAPQAQKSHSDVSSMIGYLRNFGPLSTNFSLGTVAGVCASIAIKKISRKAAFAVGTGYVTLQLLAYNGYITINWNKIEGDIVSLLDRDGDGKLLDGDVNYWQGQVQDLLKYQVPTSLAGFGSGLAIGWKYL
eukprot:m.8685 g.8685  ORF g.8685 m.8685 type:complete len:161 (+) comp3221_c0_seq1:43-525(+)